MISTLCFSSMEVFINGLFFFDPAKVEDLWFFWFLLFCGLFDCFLIFPGLFQILTLAFNGSPNNVEQRDFWEGDFFEGHYGIGCGGVGANGNAGDADGNLSPVGRHAADGGYGFAVYGDAGTALNDGVRGPYAGAYVAHNGDGLTINGDTGHAGSAYGTAYVGDVSCYHGTDVHAADGGYWFSCHSYWVIALDYYCLLHSFYFKAAPFSPVIGAVHMACTAAFISSFC